MIAICDRPQSLIVYLSPAAASWASHRLMDPFRSKNINAVSSPHVRRWLVPHVCGTEVSQSQLPDVTYTAKTFFIWGRYIQSIRLSGKKEKCASLYCLGFLYKWMTVMYLHQNLDKRQIGLQISEFVLEGINLLRALPLTWILQTFRSEWFNLKWTCCCPRPTCQPVCKNPSESWGSGSSHPAHPESFVDLLNHKCGLMVLTPHGPLRVFMTHITTQTILLSKDNSSKKEEKKKHVFSTYYMPGTIIFPLGITPILYMRECEVQWK